MSDFILAFSLFGICYMLGLKISLKYKYRKDYFESLKMFNHDMLISVNFRRDNIIELIKKEYYSKHFNQTLQSAKGNIKFQNCLSFPAFLSEHEKYELYNYFNNIGKSDAETEIKNLSNYEKIFNEMFELSNEEQRVRGSLIKKTGIIAGLIAFVVAV